MEYSDVLVDAATGRVGVYLERYYAGYCGPRPTDLIRLVTPDMRTQFIVPRGRLYPAMPGTVRVTRRAMAAARLRVAAMQPRKALSDA